MSTKLCPVDEFSNFSKNFLNKAPKPKSDLQDFLSMFEQQKMDPIMLEELKDEEDDSVVIHDFLTFEKDNVLKSEGYYVTKQSQIKGVLYIKPGIIIFEPVDSDENEIVSVSDFDSFGIGQTVSACFQSSV